LGLTAHFFVQNPSDLGIKGQILRMIEGEILVFGAILRVLSALFAKSDDLDKRNTTRRFEIRYISDK
jgi:hypothetical protein